jgi:hypothetical protein
MKSFSKKRLFEVPGRRALIKITPQVQACFRARETKEGLVGVHKIHTQPDLLQAGIIVAEQLKTVSFINELSKDLSTSASVTFTSLAFFKKPLSSAALSSSPEVAYPKARPTFLSLRYPPLPGRPCAPG